MLPFIKGDKCITWLCLGKYITTVQVGIAALADFVAAMRILALRRGL